MAQRLKDAAQQAFKHIPKGAAGPEGGGAAPGGGGPAIGGAAIAALQGVVLLGGAGFVASNSFFSVDGGE